MIESGLRSGEVADAAGVNVQTLRYYERRGLLHEPDRTLVVTACIRPPQSRCCG